ncbi:hypothetical protein Tco_0541127 [Tanacetum coccineum]
MASLKYCDKHNQVGFLKKPDESTGFAEIVDFLKSSHIRYALTHNPIIYDSLVKQFWQTTTALTLADGTLELIAIIDNIAYTITKASIRSKLQLADASGISMLPNTEVFEGMGNMSPKSGVWDQFGSNIATALICLSTGRIYNFSKLIFDGMVANLKSKTKFLMYPRFLQMVLDINIENKHLYLSIAFTKKIFRNMKRGLRGVPRPLLPAMLSIANQSAGQEGPSAIPPPSTSTPEVHPKPTPIPAPTPTPLPAPEPTPIPVTAPIPESTSTPTPSTNIEPMEHIYEQHLPTLTHELAAQTLRMEDLLQLVPALITKVALKKRRVVLSDSEDEEISNSSKQGRNLQEDKSKGYETPKKGTTTGDMDISPQGLEVAATLAETLSQIKYKRRTNKAEVKRRLDTNKISAEFEEVNTTSEVPLVSTVDVNISTASRTITYSRRSAEKKTIKDKGKAIMIEPEPEKKSKRQLEEERLNEEIARQWEAEEQQRAINEANSSKIYWNDPSVIRYHAQKMKPKSIAQARRNMIKYLKNQGNYKIKDFQGMSYNEIRPIFEKVWNFNQHKHVDPELEKKKEKDKTTQVEEEVAKKPETKRKKSIPRKSTKDSAKRRKIEKDAEKEGLKEYLDVIPREDVAIDVDSLSTKYLIMDWKTHIVLEKFMYYQVFRGDGSSKNYKILSEMLEDFDR